MKRNAGRSFVTIMIVIAVSALFLRTTVEQIMRMTVAQNEADAMATLKLISAALENYAKDHLGAYPSTLKPLTETSPVYLDRDYIAESPFKGYIYSCARLESGSYSCSAVPEKCKLTGGVSYGISTGGALISDDCTKRE